MFARTAKFRDIVRAYRADTPLVPASCNDNHRVRAAGMADGTDRPVLRCDWRTNPATGRLECRWHSESAGPPSLASKSSAYGSSDDLPRAAGGHVP
jgi:hypothetical protein